MSTSAAGDNHSGATTRRAARHRKTGGYGLAPLWIGGAAAAVVLTLGVNGTLASWTTAVITNDTNTVATAKAVILKETGPGATPATCLSSDGSGSTNSYTCSTINKYGGTTTPLVPGASQSVTVTMANVGTAPGTLALKASTCTPSGGITSGSLSACGVVQVKVECPTATPTYPTTGTATLTDFANAASAPVATLAKDATVACTFTLTLPLTASPVYAGQTLSQPLTWTLTAS